MSMDFEPHPEEPTGKYVLTLFVIAILIIGYLVWLDYGCELNGVMTWEGKKCFSDLPIGAPE